MVGQEPSLFGGNMKRYLFLNQYNVVVHLIEGDHSQELIAQFLHDFGIMFGAVSVHEVPTDSNVWLGWTLEGGTFVNPAPIEVVENAAS